MSGILSPEWDPQKHDNHQDHRAVISLVQFNMDLFLNSVNWLVGEAEFISIRAKTTRGSRVAMTPNQTRNIFYLSVLVLPEFLLIIGLGIWWRRR